MKTARFTINTPRISHETIDGEILIIDLETGHYYSLLGVGAEIWSLVQRCAPVADMIQTISHHYECRGVEVEHVLDEFLAKLQDEGLIVRDEGERPGLAGAATTGVELREGTNGRTFEAPVLNKYTEMSDLLVLDPVHEVDESGWPTPAGE